MPGFYVSIFWKVLIAKFKFISNPNQKFSKSVNQDDEESIDIEDWLSNGADGEIVMGWFAEYDNKNKVVSIIGKVDDGDIADEYPDIDDMALREALRRFTEFWEIDWNESNFLDCNSEECAAEVGAMLGVEFMINGAVGKLGDTYTIDIKMFSVATGAAENMKSVTYQGKVDGLIVEIELLSWTILGLDPPKDLIKKQRRYAESGQMTAAGGGGPNWLMWGLIGLAGIGGAAVAMGGGDNGGGDNGGGSSGSDIGEPPTFPTVP